MVVFLHGTGATAAWADEETGWSRLAQQEGFALVLPEAMRPHPLLPPKFLTNPQRWNDGSPSPIPGQPDDDDVAFLTAIADDIHARRVLVTGFSNGAAMAFRFAAERANRIAAVAPVAGYCWLPHPQPARPVPTFYLIGSLDPLVPVRGGQVRSPWQHRYLRRPPVSDSLERWAHAIGSDPRARTEVDDSPARVDIYPGPAEFRSVIIEGMGHRWPGGLGRLNHRLAGPPSQAIDATKRIWEFFQRHLD